MLAFSLLSRDKNRQLSNIFELLSAFSSVAPKQSKQVCFAFAAPSVPSRSPQLSIINCQLSITSVLAEGLSYFLESASISAEGPSILPEALSAPPDAWAERTAPWTTLVAQWTTLIAFRAVGGPPRAHSLAFFRFFHETPPTLTLSLTKR